MPTIAEAGIAFLRETLSSYIMPWEKDSSYPANLVRKTGMGVEVARVDRWAGGWQDPHNPLIIGWRAVAGNHSYEDTILVRTPAQDADAEATERFIEEAKERADEALLELYPKKLGLK